mmetsp:Transcript_26034/g.70506  ORF Transcript_26034/g.70506 Transcript_26034/m.70506 type:complete len:307 (-) Transcript_26034:67-987(-)
MGFPDTSLTLSAAPPLESPSILVRIAPVMSAWSLKALTKFAASCPVMASTTRSVSVGLIAALVSFSSFIISSSICKRPAVSTMTASTFKRFASAMPARAISTGLALVPMSNTGTFIPLPSFCSWSMAAGRYTSVATISTFFFCFVSSRASFPQAVVLPTPCKPAMRMTWGKPCSRSFAPLLPISSTSSSLTVLMNAMSGVTPTMTSWPKAFSSTFFTNRLTTGKLTSASSRARLISFNGSLIFSGVNFPSLLTIFHAFSTLRLSLSNMADRMTRRPLAGGRGAQALAGLLKLLARSTCLLGSSMMG